jgi:hypothetical protein
MRKHLPTQAAGLGALLALAAVALAACGSGDDRADAQLQIANTINYGSFGTRADIDCARGKSLNIGGSNNTLTVTGSCGGVTVGGADNKIAFERIDGELSVVGLNNTITYRAGEPTVNNPGTGNTITKG